MPQYEVLLHTDIIGDSYRILYVHMHSYLRLVVLAWVILFYYLKKYKKYRIYLHSCSQLLTICLCIGCVTHFPCARLKLGCIRHIQTSSIGIRIACEAGHQASIETRECAGRSWTWWGVRLEVGCIEGAVPSWIKGVTMIFWTVTRAAPWIVRLARCLYLERASSVYINAPWEPNNEMLICMYTVKFRWFLSVYFISLTLEMLKFLPIRTLCVLCSQLDMRRLYKIISTCIFERGQTSRPVEIIQFLHISDLANVRIDIKIQSIARIQISFTIFVYDFQSQSCKVCWFISVLSFCFLVCFVLFSTLELCELASRSSLYEV